ncbi:uncharacterized protein LOC6740023 isoform X2 [Drosophila simulans]|uniref:uncharacterized protein LOC6740023 isoform X2 n=1 Tax=Drosophila simulans TaxID=7240 RepID=UPI00078AE107|nr:uncharacterized protein LOC6740023 isoform X2 [Drosophila simulans]KMZ08731.1 uncharacterized protein Dsimw501_GD24768, isoform B [Drosophila simulans]
MDTTMPMGMVPNSLNPILNPRPLPIPVTKPRSKLQPDEPHDGVLAFNKGKVPPPVSSRPIPLQRAMSEVRDALRAQPQASDISLLIFAAAASSVEHERTLIPVPPQFQAAPGSGCQVDRLRHAVADNWPSCRILLDCPSTDEQYAALMPDDVDALHLLHWILVATPASPTLRRMSGLHLRRLCRYLGLARPTLEPGHLLSISYERNVQRLGDPSPRPRSSYAYLGLPFQYLYRFLATGRLEHPPGVAIRLYAQPETALVHCDELSSQPQEQHVQSEEQSSSQSSAEREQSGSPSSLCWRNSTLTAPQRALVICELPSELDESIAHSPEKHFLEYFVQESLTLRPCYLLLFDEAVASNIMFAWPGKCIELEHPGPSMVQRSRIGILNIVRNLGNRLGAVRRALAAI